MQMTALAEPVFMLGGIIRQRRQYRVERTEGIQAITDRNAHG